jgi:hypothetical protein
MFTFRTISARFCLLLARFCLILAHCSGVGFNSSDGVVMHKPIVGVDFVFSSLFFSDLYVGIK